MSGMELLRVLVLFRSSLSMYCGVCAGLGFEPRSAGYLSFAVYRMNKIVAEAFIRYQCDHNQHHEQYQVNESEG